MLDTGNPIVQQTIQHNKEVYIANRIPRILCNEEQLTLHECEHILDSVKKQIIR
jgi:hypothetical protein